jgi:hypothetical protein
MRRAEINCVTGLFSGEYSDCVTGLFSGEYSDTFVHLESGHVTERVPGSRCLKLSLEV